MTFGMNPEGFNRERLPDVKSEIEESLTAQFGDINLQPQSVFGQFIGSMSKIIADLWENMEATYFSQYPNTAEGISLDYVVALNGITRLSAQQTRVVAIATGTEATLITAGSLARQPSSNQYFSALENTLISRTNAVLTTVQIDDLEAQEYTAQINGDNYFYSLPRIEFDGLFTAGDIISSEINGADVVDVPFNVDSQTTLNDYATVLQALPEIATATTKLGLVINFDIDFDSNSQIIATINGLSLGLITWNTNQSGTIGDLATEIQNSPLVTTCTVTGSRELTIVPVDSGTFQVDSIITTGTAPQPVTIDQAINLVPASGFSIEINSVSASGGSSPSATDVLRTPSTINEITAGISSVINNGVDPVLATDNVDNTLTILADDPEVSYTLSVSVNMSITSLSSPVIFLSDNFGAIPVPINSLTEIVTPISGWSTIGNLEAGETGRAIETDAELRLRRQNSVRVIGAGTVESIRARILQQVDGVEQALIYENRTMTQEDTLIIFSDDLVTGNSITFTINGIAQTPISFISTHLNTMQLIQVQLELFDGIDSAPVGGTGNRTLTVSMVQGYEITITSTPVTGGATQADVNIYTGRYPKSFETVVQGGTDQDVAEKIWETKPAGIQTFGNTSYNITDSQGDLQAIFFSRPNPIYIWINIDLTLYDEEVFPTNGVDLVREAIVNYGDTLNVGEDVLWQRVLCQIFQVSGIASGALTMASSLDPNISPSAPSFLEADISIEGSELAIFSITQTSIEVV